MVAKMPAIFYFTQNFKLSKSIELNICIARNDEYDINNNNNNNNNNNKFINVSRNFSMHANWRHKVVKVFKVTKAIKFKTKVYIQ